MILYEKRGRRYYPAAHTDDYGSLPKGHHLVSVLTDGLRTTTFRVEPDYASVFAAMSELREPMIQAMMQMNELTLDERPIPPAELKRRKKAWDAYVSAYGSPAPLYFQGVSMRDVVDAGFAVLREKLMKEE